MLIRIAGVEQFHNCSGVYEIPVLPPKAWIAYTSDVLPQRYTEQIGVFRGFPVVRRFVTAH